MMAYFKKLRPTIALSLILLGAFGLWYRQSHATPICQTAKTPFAYSICTINPSTHQLSLAYQQDNKPFYTFNALIAHYPDVLFAMNAGMYDNEFAPIGYTVIDGQTLKTLNLNQGSGNFHLMPNGVFWSDGTNFYVNTSTHMAKLLDTGTRPQFATQSGPILVIDGQIHPAFNQNSTSFKWRNGVGVCHDGKVKFVKSDEPVNFYHFALLFKQTLNCPNALFLDGGSASALYSKELNRLDNKNMGVMIMATSQ